MNKRESLEEIKDLYRSLIPKDGTPCSYCGLLATDKEHVTPISWIEKAKELKAMGFNVVVPKEKIVSSCRECNLIASARIFESFREKKLYIRWKLTKKYKKWLDREEWDDCELEELSGDFRRRTTIYNEILKLVRKRLETINAEKILAKYDYFQELWP